MKKNVKYDARHKITGIEGFERVSAMRRLGKAEACLGWSRESLIS